MGWLVIAAGCALAAIGTLRGITRYLDAGAHYSLHRMKMEHNCRAWQIMGPVHVEQFDRAE